MRIASRVEIQRSIQEVFAFVAAPEHLPLWAAGVAGAARTAPGPLGLGATFALRQAGQARPACWEIIEHEPPRALAYRRLEGRAFAQCRYTLERVDGRTGLGLEVYSGAGLSPAPSPRLERAAHRRLAANLHRLRDLLESGYEEDKMTDGARPMTS